MSNIATIEQPRLPSLPSGGVVRAIVPQDFDGAWRIANAVVKAGMAPKGLDTPEKAMVAIMHGLEVGFTPMAALQSIAVINSRATIWGDGALGLVQGSGKMEWHKEYFEGEGETRKALCVVKRRGDPEAKTGEFSVADAKKAKLWGKGGPWSEYSDRMLKMRARAFALRDGFADVLKGLGIAEEVQDIQVAAPPPPPAPYVAPAPVIEHHDEQVEPEPLDLDRFIDQLDTALLAADSEETLMEVWDSFDVEATLTHDDSALQRAFDLRKKHADELATAEQPADDFHEVAGE